MTTSLLETCNRIWLHLRSVGPLTRDALCKDLEMPFRECELALTWLARRNMIDIVEEHGQTLLCWMDSEQELTD